ncbi:MAG: alcohol dehydrogenase catalytic domain-containing protein [Ktedonobacteraceae bacterium]
MRALLITEPGQADVTELSLPVPAPDEVLVRSRAVGLCSSDVELYQGKRPQGLSRYPIVPGHEWSGEIVSVGAGVRSVLPGQRVVVESFCFCGVCGNCRAGQTNICETRYDELGFTRAGGLAEYVAVPAPQVHVLPADTSFEEAALLEPAAVVAHAFLRAQPRPGSVIAIVGDDPACLLAVQFARLFSPRAVVLLGFRAERLELAHAFGATHTLNISREEPQELLNELTSGKGADLVFEGTGHAQAVEEALRRAKRGGTVLLEGITSSIAPLSMESDIFVLKHLAVFGVFGANSAAWTYTLDLYRADLLKLAPLISHRFPLDDYQVALDALTLRVSRALKVLVLHA